MIWQNIKMALVSIKSAKLRSFLTMLGVIIGVFAVLTMIGIGDGVKAQVTGQVTSLGTNLLTVTSGQIGQNASTAKNGQQQKGGGLGFSSSLGSSTLTEKDVRTIQNTTNVVNVAPVSIVSSIVTQGELSSSTPIISGTSANYGSIRSLKYSAGGFFSDQDNSSAAKVAVIGADTKQNLFGEADAMGKTIGVRGQQFIVTGVLQKSDAGSSLGPNLDDVVDIPINTANQITDSNQISRILVEVNDPKNIDSTQAAITQELKSNHGGQQDFSVLTQKDLLSTFNSILDILTTFVVAIASISLLVGGIGIMNIMLVSVTERTREIGIRKAIGATSGNILSQFLIEAVIISILGGLLGLGLSYLAGRVVQKVANITPVFSFKALLLALGVSLAVGVVFGVAPAVKAARKRPIQALKAL
ncbi:ABC transporter permease [Candidatus Saccharibacteria bacterium]|nr:ABC transporter permease [Candidatus Saccharibacteria bacterium]